MDQDLQESENTSRKLSEPVEQQPRQSYTPRPIAAVVAGGFLVVVAIVGALVFFSRFLNPLSDPAQFITGNLINVLILIAIVFLVLIYRNQRDIMEQQWKAMREQLNDVNRQLSITERAVRVSENQVKVADDQLSVLRQSLQKTELVISQNERAIKASQQSAEAAQQTLIHSQRAYVTIPRGDIHIRTDGNQIFQLEVRNTGNSPANNLAIEICAQYGHPTIDASPGIPIHIGLIAPACSIMRHSKAVQHQNTEEMLCCFGKIMYADVFGEARETRFCLCQDQADAARFGPCEARDHNQAS